MTMPSADVMIAPIFVGSTPTEQLVRTQAGDDCLPVRESGFINFRAEKGKLLANCKQFSFKATATSNLVRASCARSLAQESGAFPLRRG
jgi:hypothetical protein